MKKATVVFTARSCCALFWWDANPVVNSKACFCQNGINFHVVVDVLICFCALALDGLAQVATYFVACLEALSANPLKVTLGMFQISAEANSYPAAQEKAVALPLQVAATERSTSIQQHQALGVTIRVGDNCQVFDV